VFSNKTKLASSRTPEDTGKDGTTGSPQQEPENNYDEVDEENQKIEGKVAPV
jgi:hypothetical protein